MNYQILRPLTEKNTSYIVQNTDSGQLYVRKSLEVYDISVYQYLSHNRPEGIPQIVELQETPQGLVVIEEYIHGKTIDEILKTQGPLQESIALEYLDRLCSILAPLHAATPPIVHRDIKPSNIIIDDSNRVYLLDFNAATHYSESKDYDTVLIGTTGYAAPEQYGFQASDPRADVYAIGRVAQELFTGEKTLPENYNGPCSSVIKKCLNLDPKDRYENAEDLKHAFLGSNASHKISHKWYIPPGFRTHTPWKMFVAILGYLTASIMFIPTNSENDPIKTSGDVFVLIMIILEFFLLTNYMGIQHKLPFATSNKWYIKIPALALYAIILLLSFAALANFLGSLGILELA